MSDVRLILVIGTQSGGTSAVSSILHHNGYWIRNPRSFFEDGALGNVFNELSYPDGFSPPDEPPSEEWIQKLAQFFSEYKAEAKVAGYSRAVIKYPNRPIWFAEIISKMPVEPLLVWRNPDHVAQSIKRRWKNTPNPEEVAKMGQDEIVRLRDVYGWPMWEFGEGSDQISLGQLIGEELPTVVFAPGKIHFK